MTSYEYKVVPAPKKGVKAKGLKSAEDRFANALQTAMNDLGADGWEYQRTDTLPCEEREGLMGKTTVFQNMLVFRRVLHAQPEQDVETPVITPALAAPTPEPEPRVTATIAADPPAPMLENKPLAADPARVEPRVAAE